MKMNSKNEIVKLSNKTQPKTAMILAAGLGTRMRPITNKIPKPLVKVCGKTMLDHALDAVKRAGVTRAIINVHYLPEQIEAHVAKRKDMEIIISDERDQLLDSAGGIVNVLPQFGADPFYVLNADSFWIEGFKPNLLRMAEQWNPDEMDIQLLLAGTWSAIGFGSKGDFNMDADGRLIRRGEKKIAPFAYAGAAIMKPEIFNGVAKGPSSLNPLFDIAIERERLFGVRLEGLWLHVGTPDAIHEAEDAIARSAA